MLTIRKVSIFTFSNLKSWCVVNKTSTKLVFMDDKAKIPVGDPACPEAATSHMRKALTTKPTTLESSDHNYHCGNLTPSVNLLCDIPDSPSESFYAGQIYVGLKDSVFQGSDPIRHVIELIGNLRAEYKDSVIPPYLVLFTDGGADHNMTFLYVQCALLSLFRVLDLDILNVGRCAPNQSYINPAERCMSLLNLGLQGLATERDHVGEFENIIKSCSSMKTLREKAKQQQGVKEMYLESLHAPINILESTFQLLELKGKPIKIFKPNRDVKEVINALQKVSLFSNIELASGYLKVQL